MTFPPTLEQEQSDSRGGEGSSELSRGLLAEGTTRPLLVVLPPPGLNRLACIPHTEKPLLTQVLIAELPVEGL